MCWLTDVNDLNSISESQSHIMKRFLMSHQINNKKLDLLLKKPLGDGTCQTNSVYICCCCKGGYRKEKSIVVENVGNERQLQKRSGHCLAASGQKTLDPLTITP